MTDRYNGLLVTLKEPMRDDDLEGLIQAILLLSPVLTVTMVAKNDHDLITARNQARALLAGKLWDILYPEVKT